MADTAGESITCQYCGTDIQVSAERSRYEASVAHFEAEHINRVGTPRDAGERTDSPVGAAPHMESEEQEASD